MKIVELYLRVRQSVFVEGRSRRETARLFGIARKTVDKMCAFSAPPGYRRRSPAARPKLDGFTCSATIWMRSRIASPNNVPERLVVVSSSCSRCRILFGLIGTGQVCRRPSGVPFPAARSSGGAATSEADHPVKLLDFPPAAAPATPGRFATVRLQTIPATARMPSRTGRASARAFGRRLRLRGRPHFTAPARPSAARRETPRASVPGLPPVPQHRLIGDRDQSPLCRHASR